MGAQRGCCAPGSLAHFRRARSSSSGYGRGRGVCARCLCCCCAGGPAQRPLPQRLALALARPPLAPPQRHLAALCEGGGLACAVAAQKASGGQQRQRQRRRLARAAASERLERLVGRRARAPLARCLFSTLRLPCTGKPTRGGSCRAGGGGGGLSPTTAKPFTVTGRFLPVCIHTARRGKLPSTPLRASHTTHNPPQPCAPLEPSSPAASAAPAVV